MSNVQGKKIYLALLYSHPAPYIREVRYRTATSAAVFLMKRGAIVFSPITYGHQLCQYGIDTHFEGWADIDRPLISWADEIWLLEIEGYDFFYIEFGQNLKMLCIWVSLLFALLEIFS